MSNYISLSDLSAVAQQQIGKKIDNLILDELYKAVLEVRVGIHIDINKVRKWVEMCVYLETLPDELRLAVGVREKLRRQSQKIKRLEAKINALRDELNRGSYD